MGLAERIEAAFESVPPPPTDRVVTPTYDDEGVTGFFKGKHWRDVSIDELRTHHVALSFFSPEAFHYYVPAFMLAELRDPIAAGQIGPSLLFHFSRPEEPSWEPELRQRLALLTAEQKAVVADFVRDRGRVCGYTDPEIEEIVNVVKNGI
jgi:hypothetical protein